MRALNHMKQVLEDTGLYVLEGDSPVDWELEALGQGLFQVEERFEKLLGDLFPQTAGRERLAQWESLYRPQPAQASLEQCLDMVLRRMAVREDGFRLQDLQKLLPGAGVQGVLIEADGSLKVVLGRLLGVTEDEADRELDQLLPSHLVWSWDTSVTWVALDAYTRPFEEWDGQGYTWAQWDAVTRDDLETSEEDA